MFKENNISILAPDVFSGLPNLDTLDLSKNKLGDESLSQNLLSVSEDRVHAERVRVREQLLNLPFTNVSHCSARRRREAAVVP